ncbi:MAG: family 10 glycosylhydrolase [Cyanobacteriota bacterium]|nr:family 10 glycosylhydrolase [Cyanobacteriota bacterium]
MSKIQILKHKIIPALAASLIGLTLLLPTGAKANVLLGVVKTDSNEENWNQITARLEGNAISYQAIQLEEINSREDLKGIAVLFLPNVENVTDAQLQALQEWVDGGGRLIASGPIGRKSSARVRQQLRSLLGSYWAFELNQPTSPEGINRCLDVSCTRSTGWVPQDKTNVTVEGAVLIPSGLNSTTAATWQDGVGSSAVIITEQATYLGWHWGESADGSVDAAWMQAVLNRYSSSVTGNSQVSDRSIPIPEETRDSLPEQTRESLPEETRESLAEATRESLPEETRESLAEATRESLPEQTLPPLVRGVRKERTEEPENDNTTAVRRRPPITDLFKTLPSRRQPPSERSAPPGLEVAPGGEAISNAQANAMVEELKNLLARFENALIAANSVGVDVDFANDDGNLLASSRADGTFIGRGGMGWKQQLADVAAKTQKAIEQLPQLVRERKYDLARQQWLEAREMLWENYPRDGLRAAGEIRAVWLDRGTIVRARSPEGLAGVFNRLAAAGINTVFFETVNAGYAIYPSNVAPKQNPLTLEWDPLEAAVKLAKERNMEIHAWLWTFAVGNKAHNVVANQSEDYLGPVIAAHPTWVMTDNRGRKRHPNDGKTYMDPANPQVRQYLMRLIDEIANRYKVDGIHLDYIRYPFQDPGVNFTHGYGSYGRLEFQRLHGVDPMDISPTGDRQMWWKWTEFRIEKINTFVADVSRMLRLRYPDAILSAAVFPLPQQERLWKIQQEWETWTRRGDVDLLTPMTYALDTNRLQQLASPLINEEHLGHALIAPAIKLLNISEIIAIDQVQALRDLPAGGYSIFAAERIYGDFERFLLRTQGPESARDSRDFTFVGMGRRAHLVEGPIPYRQPFLAAAARYRSLKQEWGFLLAEDQLEISKSALKDLRRQSKDLERALEQLAKSPSAKRLEKARRSLETLQSEFGVYMRSHASDRPLQVQAWENRLAALDMLLNYGEEVRLKSERF